MLRRQASGLAMKARHSSAANTGDCSAPHPCATSPGFETSPCDACHSHASGPQHVGVATSIGRGLIIQHGLWQTGWRFKFDRATLRISHCDYRKKIVSLSSHLAGLNPAEQVLDAILHRIAHVLCGSAAGLSDVALE